MNKHDFIDWLLARFNVSESSYDNLFYKYSKGLIDKLNFVEVKKIIDSNYHYLPSVKEINDLVDDYGVFYFNTLDSSKLNSNLINFFKDENINSALICKIDVFEHYYGLVRFEMVKGRIWQPHDLDVALTISKTLGVILSHLNNYRF